MQGVHMKCDPYLDNVAHQRKDTDTTTRRSGSRVRKFLYSQLYRYLLKVPSVARNIYEVLSILC